MSAMSRNEFLWEANAYYAEGLSDEQVAARMGLSVWGLQLRLTSAQAMATAGSFPGAPPLCGEAAT
ncbi:hypothetical protein BKG83_13715 [Mycobacteroides chelonae]|jgi:DNA-binding transcriptional regulator LsrR (DeoR family)|uniref:Uncharacterized protein n=1 Tax=Mycobacteroides chelonae TaxID=1774 RepID=A0A1S1LZU1_MYCCH|nr:hypothetical protein [Mycobacteroides chelonae]PKQ58326.1 hypothetical protein B5566_09170 [Mycobacterium sp. MHSD3]SKO54895.1 Uncharacterised protein [Mycobacteroides abscessus subsp. bolletii]MBF9520181.1 hypothetical protein [Mycobacteroides chelonae]OHU55336.1 hypothetical protein BKG83_13715 [Mycobacteroides chelonae]OHU75957.1 hypothetical protein BKG84_25470 [Mycobacteroides chelonae]